MGITENSKDVDVITSKPLSWKRHPFFCWEYPPFLFLTCVCPGIAEFFVTRRLQIKGLGLMALITYFTSIFFFLAMFIEDLAMEKALREEDLPEKTVSTLVGLLLAFRIAYSLLIRIAVRLNRNIPQSLLEDALFVCLCNYCAICQEYSEVVNSESKIKAT